MDISGSLKQQSWRSKLRAAAIHFGLSLCIFLVVAAVLLLWWYPSFYFNMSGGWQGMMLMLCVDVVLGPLLTLLVFNPRKKRREIITDFAVIGLVQLAAFCYGLHTVYMEHPKMVVVFGTGTATALSVREIGEDEHLSQLDTSGFVRLAGVPLLTHSVEHEQTVYSDAAKTPQLLDKADKETRMTLASVGGEQAMAQLKALEQQYGTVRVLSVMGKYTGAYIVVDKDLNYVGKIGESSVS